MTPTSSHEMIEKLNVDAGAMLQLLLDSIRDYSIVMLDKNGCVVTWAIGAAELHGYTESEIIGRHFSIFYSDEDKMSGLPKAILAEALETGRWEGDCVHLRKDGSRYWANVVVKPLQTDERGVAGFAKVTRDITERRQAQDVLQSAQLKLESMVAERTRELAVANEELRRLATTDPLTGLPNRRHFLSVGTSEIERSQRYGHPLVACMIDVDHFKEINDAHGHAAGDAVLVEIVRRIGAQLRTGDIFARLAGDEFVVLLVETDIDTATIVAQRLREAVAAGPISCAASHVAASISIGAAILSEQESLDELLTRADRALLKAKGLRNKVELAEGHGGQGNDDESKPKRGN